MKILIVIPALGSVYGGPSKSVLEFSQALGNRGLKVDIVTTSANGNTKLGVPTGTWIQEKFYRVQYFDYWNIFDYKLSFSLTSWLLGHVKDYDLVHTNAIFSYPVLPAHWACQLHRIPYIMTPHGMLEPWALAYKSWKKNFYFTLLEKPALQSANAIQMLASTEAKRVEPIALKTPLVIVPNGIHQQDFQCLPDADLFYQQFPHTRHKKLILFLGRIDPKKGLDLLAGAFDQIHRQYSDTRLIIAGPDNTGFLKTAQNYFVGASCREAVTFTGMLTGPLKYAALAAASIYVAPSYSEGFSISVLEGMATGLPCVITTGCNFPEAETHKAALVVDIDADQIANSLLWCLQNPQQAKAMGDRARQFIFEKYTWESIASEMERVYQKYCYSKL
ncbi:MAG: D-inositol-3-phosphate glycosyltransferase [Chroococcopsis gigantea SAG 12.99]|jgi:glycosyltransferase involved in cell wall biosynthesis|nr:D-inositol-3-phosphate glycosyltransferase [Chroococcopsis gigantea SAG 12.99]